MSTADSVSYIGLNLYPPRTNPQKVNGTQFVLAPQTPTLGGSGVLKTSVVGSKKGGESKSGGERAEV